MVNVRQRHTKGRRLGKGGSIEAIVSPFLQPVRPNKRWGVGVVGAHCS